MGRHGPANSAAAAWCTHLGGVAAPAEPHLPMDHGGGVVAAGERDGFETQCAEAGEAADSFCARRGIATGTS